GIRDRNVTGVQTCALPIYRRVLDCLAVADVVDREELDLVAALAGRDADACPLLAGALEGAGGVDVGVAAVGRVVGGGRPRGRVEIGRASCRERVEVAGGAG